MKPSLLKSLLDEHIAPVLAEHGFTRRKSTWNRRIDGIVHRIHFEVSKGHTPGEREMFTVEVEAAVDAVMKVLNEELPRSFHSWHSVTHERIGYLRPAGDRFDKWWDLKSESDILSVAGDVIHDLCTYAMPTLDRIQSLHDVREFVMEVDSHMPGAPMYPYVKLGLAAICFIMGDHEEYEKLKDDLIYGKGKGPRYDSAFDPWPKRMAEVAARLESMDLDAQADRA